MPFATYTRRKHPPNFLDDDNPSKTSGHDAWKFGYCRPPPFQTQPTGLTIPSKSLGKATFNSLSKNMKQQEKQNHGIAQGSRETHCKIRGKQTLDDMALVEKGLLVLGRFTNTDGDEVRKLAHDVVLVQTRQEFDPKMSERELSASANCCPCPIG